ncbi:MAG: carboxypeptidase-like regulatory domain-containing protein [Blastocatellia bacterium]|nr:carboxypeptidase-like regulatory domain-containing protein [Blastocatellia bacterium]
MRIVIIRILWAGLLLTGLPTFSGGTLSGSLLAQNIKAALNGQVTDSQGRALAGVTVTVTDVQRGLRRTVQSDPAGTFHVPGLEAGTYRIELVKDGFAPLQHPEITLEVGAAVWFPATLGVQEMTEVVNVTGHDEIRLQTDNPKVSRSFSAVEMNDLPVAAGGQGRNFYTQARTAPGVALSTQAHAPFAVSGNRARSNNYLLDSVDNTDASTGLVTGRGVTEQLVSQEAVASFEILTHNFKAEYGRNSGGIVSLVSKGGGNQFHGSGYLYHNNSALRARNFFESAKPSNRANLFGLTLGGPIRRNRAFFFVQYEANLIRGGTPTLFQGLTTAEREAAVPAVRALVDLYPQIPAGNSRQFILGLPRNTDQHTYLVRTDIALTSRQTLMVRFNVSLQKIGLG